MGGISDFLRGELLNHVLGSSAYTSPSSVYVALYSIEPNSAGGGTEISTAGGTNYNRLAITNNNTNFTDQNTTKVNSTPWTFTSAASSYTVVAAALFDSSAAGNLLVWSSLATSKVIDVGDIPQFSSGDFRWNMTS